MTQGVNGKKPKTFYAIINVKWSWKRPFTTWRKPYLKHIDMEQVCESNAYAFRYNDNRTKAIISFKDKPSFLKEDRVLTREDLRLEIRKGQW